MTALRKITVHLPAELIDGAQAATGAGITETVRQGLEKLRREQFYRRMEALRGKTRTTAGNSPDDDAGVRRYEQPCPLS